jgi:hypothetical protein
MVPDGVPGMTEKSTRTTTLDRGRFSANRKTDAVLRLLPGGDVDTPLPRGGRHRRHAVLPAGRLPRRRQGRPQELTGRGPGRAN